jgi:hypothetical protein
MQRLQIRTPEREALVDMGDIVARGMLVTRLRTIKHVEITILSPIYHSLRDGNLSTIPELHSPSAEAAPAFRVRSVGPAERGEVERPPASTQPLNLRDRGTLRP